MEKLHEITNETFKCIEECNNCAQVCKETLIYCMHMEGEHIKADHLELMLACSKMCEISADLMATHSTFASDVCIVCASICESCAIDCGRFMDKEMDKCTKACRNCAQACRKMAVR